jgi:isopenicillin-N N-acyltransferase-like protein
VKTSKAFKVVECQGTPYEIGFQYGSGCRDSILRSIEINFGILTAGYGISKEKLIETAKKYLPAVENFDPEIIETIKGQATGAGVSFDEAFALRCTLEIGPYYPIISGLCTSFAVTGKATKDGKTILGQNIDWYPGFPVDLLKIKRNDGITQLTLSLGGFAEYTLSSAGFGMCANSTMTPTDGFRLNIPLACYLPKAMRQKNISDALGVLCQAARGVGYYHLASAEGDMVGIESVFDDFNILYSENDTLIHSNHYLTERFKKGDLAYMGIPDSYLRLPRIRDLIRKNYGQITPATMMDILSDHNSYPLGICRHYDNETQRLFNAETLASFIMVPEDRKMYIAWGTPCQYEYVTYEL